MADITRDQPGDALKRRIRANAIGTTCEACGEPVLRSNVVVLTDGQRVCPVCFDALLEAMLEGGE